MTTVRVLALSGSLRQGSYNTELLRLAAAEAPASVVVELYEGLGEVPPFDADREAVPGGAVEALRAAIASADALLVATPEYNGSAPGVLKNAVDWASRPYGESALKDVPVAVVGASPGRFGAAWAAADVRKALGISGARVLEAELAVGAAHERLGDPDARLRTELRGVVGALAGAVEPVVADAA